MTKEEFLEMAAKHYEAISDLQEHKDFYTYEKGFEQVWTDLGREVLEQSIDKVPTDRRKKTQSGPDLGK
jgi:hypothetical protein